MSITSLGFLAFVAVVLAVYYFLSPRQQNYWLLAASYIFCATFAWQLAGTCLMATGSQQEALQAFRAAAN